MPAQAYELLAMGARYWFAFLGVIIVWRSFLWLRKDARLRRKRLKQLPDAGLVGELVVLAGSDTLPPGTVIPLPREGTLGSLRSCDVSIPCPGVAPRHGDFRFENGVGLVLTPAARMAFTVDGQEADPAQREWVLHHGSRLLVGDALLRMRLFMGLETARTAALQPDAEEEPLQAVVMEDALQEGELNNFRAGYRRPAPAAQNEDANWEEYTSPHRQLIRSWQDTAPYAVDRGRQAPPPGYGPQEEPEDAYGESGYGEDDYLAQEDLYDGQADGEPEDGQSPYPQWESEDTFIPPPRRGLFHRRRR